ncbi:mobile element protein [Limimaricola cinnabarinus LL-001]|uniref:Mobile element protein n=1 Tax=Limimaricola cinnabarinus LL-001 TaxID=1337093 RepID=U2Z916_9RHOB|nr:mobile element protein [Limimaricola cinnabarinus LL-001]
MPDFSTLSRRQKTLAVNIPYRGSRGPLHLLVDSTGIKVEGEGEWHARKHGGTKRRVWRKIHLGIDEQTLEVRAVEVTGNHIGDAPVLPDLLSQIPPEQEIGSVTADGAYDTRKCHDAIADRGAHAVIPPRKNAKPWKPTTAGAVARNEALRASKYLGRAIWRNWSGYHRRSRAETKMNCMKLLGQRLMARDFDRQVAEVQIRIAIMNGYTALGIPITKAVG